MDFLAIVDIIDMVDNMVLADNMKMVDSISMVNMQKTFGYLKLLVDRWARRNGTNCGQHGNGGGKIYIE